LEQAKVFRLFMLKAVFSGHGDKNQRSGASQSPPLIKPKRQLQPRKEKPDGHG
jgi:hypothetical protein